MCPRSNAEVSATQVPGNPPEMPVRRGHVAPRTTIIETIIKKFDTHGTSSAARLMELHDIFAFSSRTKKRPRKQSHSRRFVLRG